MSFNRKISAPIIGPNGQLLDQSKKNLARLTQLEEEVIQHYLRSGLSLPDYAYSLEEMGAALHLMRLGFFKQMDLEDTIQLLHLEGTPLLRKYLEKYSKNFTFYH